LPFEKIQVRSLKGAGARSPLSVENGGEEMIPRYSRNLMAKVWEPENRFRTWLKIEIYACEAMARLGQVPPEAVKIIRKKAGFETARIDAIE